MSGAERLLLATFCDDIRYEHGNKHSLMGCYKQDLVVNQLPAALPKLCAAVLVLTPIDQPFEKLTICARLDNESLAELELGEDQLLTVKSEMVTQRRAGRRKVEVTCHMAFTPFVITQEGELRIEAISEEGTIKGSTLQIRLKPQADRLGKVE